jgi:SOS response regulatory protein OraA/RecX
LTRFSASLTHAISLASAYATAVERATGQFKRADQELGAANRLANKGFSAQQVQQATQEVARAALARRAGVPALADVERHLMVETPPS